MRRMTFLEVMLAVYQERQRQIEKWGVRRKLHPDKWIRIMSEELGEIAKEVEDDETGENIRTELVQLAALCVAWLTGDEPPLHEALTQPLWSKCKCSECDCLGRVHRSLASADGLCFGCARGLHIKEETDG